MDHINETTPSQEGAFRSEICGKLSLPIKDMEIISASGKVSIWPKSNSQEGRILLTLANYYARWVGVHYLMRIANAAAVHSVVAKLRKRGWPISNLRGERIIRNGTECRKSEYRLSFEGGISGCQKKTA